VGLNGEFLKLYGDFGGKSIYRSHNILYGDLI